MPAGLAPDHAYVIGTYGRAGGRRRAGGNKTGRARGRLAGLGTRVGAARGDFLRAQQGRAQGAKDAGGVGEAGEIGSHGRNGSRAGGLARGVRAASCWLAAWARVGVVRYLSGTAIPGAMQANCPSNGSPIIASIKARRILRFQAMPYERLSFPIDHPSCCIRLFWDRSRESSCFHRAPAVAAYACSFRLRPRSPGRALPLHLERPVRRGAGRPARTRGGRRPPRQ